MVQKVPLTGHMSPILCDNIYGCDISEQLFQWMSVRSLGSINIAYSFSELTQNNSLFTNQLQMFS